jgi:zinc protease
VTRNRLLIAAAVVVIAIVTGLTVTAVRKDDHAPPTVEGQAAAAACESWDAAPAVGDTERVVGPGTPLSPDGGAREGVLGNGLHYYVRNNDHPGQNAELRLVVNAGSSLEDKDQAGAAHFVEHMLFNGTEQFPANKLNDTLRSLGVQLGPDLNAYTTDDETVYSLSVDSKNRDAVSTALDVLYQWATKATIADDAVQSERGVILSEERDREESPDGRRQQHAETLLFAGSPYEGHAPIGTVDSINTMTPDSLRRFYRDWYRADLMAVVAVGDFDDATMERDIRDRFDQMQGASPFERARPAPTVSSATTARLDSFDDPETTQASAELLFGHNQSPETTSADVRDRVSRDLALEIVENRLSDDAARAQVPYYNAASNSFPLVRDFDVGELVVTAEPKDLRDGVRAALAEIVRARKLGFDDAELARAVAAERQTAERTLENAHTRQDAQWADDYTTAYLTDAPVVDPQSLHDAQIAALDDLDTHAVDAALREATSCRDLSVLASGPDTSADEIPTVDDLNAAIAQAGATTPTSRAPEPAAPAQLMDRPAPAPVVERKAVQIYDQATELTFANGVRVVINPTPVQQDGFVFGALSPGGLSAVADGDVANAQLASDLVDNSGVGAFDKVQLEQILAGHLIELHSAIDDATEGFTGFGATADLESLLQLVHLEMTSPRVDEGALRSVVGNLRIVAADPTRSPDAARMHALDQLHFGDAPRERTVPTTADLDAVTADKALAVYKERFGDASDFVFTITGAVSMNDAISLAQSYLGTLPGTGRQEVWQDVRPDPPITPNRVEVQSGHGTKATITIVYDVATPTDPETRAHAELLQLLLDQRLFDTIREKLAATYTPQVSVAVRDRPDQGTETSIEVQVDAARVDEVVDAIDEVVGGISTDGPSDDELNGVIAQVARQESFYSNESLSTTWLTTLTRPGGTVADEQRRVEAVSSATKADLVSLAAQLWPPDHRLELRVVPAA